MPYYIYIIIAVIALLLWEIVWIYNKLVGGRQRAEEEKSNIQTQEKRRYDLVPNLVETVKGYAGHEQATLEKVTQARTRAMTAGGSVKEHQAAENMFTDALKSIFALSEAYPDLKANQNFLKLQEDLADTENHIQQARETYNAVVRDYNILVESFAANVIAKQFGFLKYEFYETGDEAAGKPVQVKF